MITKDDVTTYVFYCPYDKELLDTTVDYVLRNNTIPIKVFDKNLEGIIKMQREAMERCATKYAWFVHVDVRPEPNCLEELIKFVNNTQDTAVVEAELYHDDDVILHGHTNPDWTEENLDQCSPNPNSIHTACTLIRNNLEIDYFPPDKWKFGGDDVWLSQTILSNGYDLGHANKARGYHLGSYATRNLPLLKKMEYTLRYCFVKKSLQKHFGEVLQKPFRIPWD